MEASNSLSKLDTEAWRTMELTAPLPDSEDEEMDEEEARDTFMPENIDPQDYYSDLNLSKLQTGQAREDALLGHEESHILPGMNLSTKVANAEQKLLRALSKDRFFASTNVIKRATVAGHDMDHLDELRIPPEAALRREILAEQEMMNAMDQSKPEVPWDPKDFPLIEHSKQARKNRHDEGLKKYKNTVVVVADDLEERVVQACYQLRELQIDQDIDLQEFFDALNVDDDLRERDRQYVLQAWEIIATKLGERRHAVESFGATIQGIEEERSTRIKSAVATLIDDLVGVSYLLRPEIQRLVEAESNLANNVIITNLQAASDCTARLRRMHVEVGIQRRAQWEIRERDWRRLRHNDAIARFHRIIDSNEYRNPELRQQVLSAFRTRQEERQTTIRLPLLAKLGNLTVPPNLSTTAVKQVLAEFEELHVNEEQETSALTGKGGELAECSADLLTRAEGFREALRVECHYYGALAEKPDLMGCSNRMSSATGIVAGGAGIIEDEELADFFRRSGNLKNTLKKIIEGQTKPTLVYQIEAKEVLRLVMGIRAAMNIHTVLEEQGKGGDRSSVQSTLEKLRTGKSADVGKNSKSLLRKLRSFTSVTGLEELFMMELASIVAGLASIFEPKGSNGTGNRKKRINPQEHLSELRALQRRAGSLIYACDLPEIIKETLNEANISLRQQIYANSKIDAVIEKECAKKIKKRVSEDQKLVSRIKRFLNAQVNTLAKAPQRFCKFYSFVANEAQKNADDTQNLDDTFEDDLVELLDNYDADHDAKETTLKQQLHSLRYARNSEFLAKYFDDVVATLQSIEKEYRRHGGELVKRADRYPIEASIQYTKYSLKICQHLGVIAPETVAAAKRKFEKETKTASSSGIPAIDEESAAEVSAAEHVVEKSGEEVDGDDVAADGEGGSDGVDGEDIADVAAEADADEDTAVGDGVDGDVPNDGEEGEENEGGADGDAEEDGDGGGGDEEGRADVVLEEYTKEDDGPPPPPKGSWEEFQTLSQLELGGDLHVVRNETRDVGRELIGAPLCEEAKELSEPTPTGELTPAEIKDQALTPEETSVKEKFNADAKAAMKWKAKLPYDVEGNATCKVVVFTVEQITDLLTRMRDAFLSLTSDTWSKRIVSVTKISKRHRRKSLYDLEERLRLHWPRKGNADVMYMQPRIGEISAHRKRLERQKRNVMQRHNSQSKKFNGIVDASKLEMGTFLEQLGMLIDMLKTQSSLAGLQGVMKRCKDSVKEFDEHCASKMESLDPFVEQRPRELVESNSRFISTCLTYEEEGDYDIEEVDICKAALAKVDKKCSTDVEMRIQTIQSLSKEHFDARNRFQDFDTNYKLTVKDLSMREGVGKKYGQPRRNFLESIRTISTFTERARQKLDNAIDVIKSVCIMKAGDVMGKPGVAPQMDTITRELLFQSVFVRTEFRIRVNYMNALTPGTVMLENHAVPLSTDSDDMVKSCEENNESQELFEGKIFAEQIQEFKKTCGEATKAIYEAEGKMDEVGDDGVPEKLRIYLEKKTKDAMIFGRETTKEFRAQVQQFQLRLIELPKALYRDVAARAKAVMLRHISEIERNFILINDESEARRGIHKMELRPELGSPNYTDELNRLCSTEKERSLQLCVSIVEAERSVLEVIEKSSIEYMNEMTEVTKSMLHLLDTIVAPWDIRDMRTPEEIQEEAAAKKRPSLKTLRKLRSKEDSGKTVPAGTIVVKDWPSLPTGELRTKKYIPGIQSEEQVLIDRKKPPREEGDEESEETSENLIEEEEETPPGEPIPSRTTTASRSTVRWRDRGYVEYKTHFHSMCAMYKMRFEKLLEEERTWAANWNKMCDILTAKSQEGGIL
jgi:hypothetical protein